MKEDAETPKRPCTILKIVRSLGPVVLKRTKSFRRAGKPALQVWEFTGYGAEPVTTVVAVRFAERTLAEWKRLDLDFEGAVTHYEGLIREARERRGAEAPTACVSARPENLLSRAAARIGLR